MGAEGEPDEQDASLPTVSFVGRLDRRDPAGPVCGWAGCRIIANFAGSAVRVKLNERAEDWMQGGPSEWDVSIDGTLRSEKLVLEVGIHDYVLATNLPAGPHRIELYKRSEAQNGYTQFLGYDFPGGALLAPPPKAPRRIEIVGDSAAAGFGVEGVAAPGADCPAPVWAAHWQNFHKAFGARLGDIFGADVHATVFSGKGLVRDIWRADDETMPVLYGRANPVYAASVFDLKSFIPHIIIVMIGGNDFAIGQPEDNGPASLAEFTQATSNLVSTFRARAPAAHVFLTLSPSVSDEFPPERHTRTNIKTAFDAVAGARASSGDSRVYSVAPPIAGGSELTGCNGHGNPAFHERVAQQLATMIRAKTSW